MKVGFVQGFLSLMVVGSVMLVTCAVVLVPVLSGLPLTPYVELLKSYTGSMSGLTGIVIGYYFGRRADSGEA